jgi:hypothetical protein
MVADADKFANKAESEWHEGRDERKALKYAEKSCRKANKAYSAAIETERSLSNIMAGLREVRGRTLLGSLR